VVQLPAAKSPVWKLEKDGDHYRIVDTASGLVLDGSAEQVVLKKPDGGTNQLWGFEKVGKAYHIKCKGMGRVLDVSDNSAADGTRIITWDLKYPPEANQLWMLAEAKMK